MMARMGQPQGGQDPWVFVNDESDFTVKKVEMTADKIDDDIKVLVVIHPKEITDKAQYAITSSSCARNCSPIWMLRRWLTATIKAGLVNCRAAGFLAGQASESMGCPI